MNEEVRIVLVDDHVLLRSGLATLVEGLGYCVIYECSNGRELIEQIGRQPPPHVVLMDINMPLLDGFETTLWLKINYPGIRVLAISMYDNEASVIRMIKNGACGYILKDSRPAELREAITSIVTKGFYYSELVSGRLIRSIQDDDYKNNARLLQDLSTREIEFLKLAASELTYKQIAQHLHVSPRTVDGYRDQLFQKLNVVSRVGLVLFAIKNKIVAME